MVRFENLDSHYGIDQQVYKIEFPYPYFKCHKSLIYVVISHLCLCGGRSMREKSFEKKDVLIEAAMDEFTSRNYENASLNNIIKGAGISKGTFYYHFKDKQDLYLYLLMAAGETQVEFTNKLLREHAEEYKGRDIFQKIKLQFQIAGEFAAAYPRYHRLINMVLKEDKNEINKDMKDLFESSTDMWLDRVIEKAMEDREFNSRFSSDFIKKIMRYMYINYFEIFDHEGYEISGFLEDINSFAGFLKYGFGKEVI